MFNEQVLDEIMEMFHQWFEGDGFDKWWESEPYWKDYAEEMKLRGYPSEAVDYYFSILTIGLDV